MRMIFSVIARLATMFVCIWPLLLCFGLFTDDIGGFFHSMVILLVFAIVTSAVSTFLSALS